MNVSKDMLYPELWQAMRMPDEAKADYYDE